jgi:glycosyltransferase involved in cell wall biosynthesis
MAKTRIAYLVTHPIQYQAPLLRRLAADPDIELTVFFGSDFSLHRFVDPGFNRAIEWDVPLVEGYQHRFLPTLFGALKQGESPSFWRPFNRGLAPLLAGRFDVLWVHGYNRAFHWRSILSAKRLGMKVLIRDEATNISAHRSKLKQMVKRSFFRLLDRFVDGYLAIGTLNRDYYRAFGIKPEKIFLTPYAVDNRFFQDQAAKAAPEREMLRVKLGLKPDRPIVLFAAKLIDRKRPFDLLDAFLKIHNEPGARQPYLLLAGDGPLKSALAQRIAEEGSSNIRMLGFQSQAELARLYDLSDIFVLPSERESWGLVVNEAMNSGRAIIVNDRIGAGADLVHAGQNGFVYPFGDVDALSICLRSILRDPERCRSMGQRSLKIIDRWSFEEDLMGLRNALSTIRRQR